jgi:virginiamycin B lyase
MGSAARAGTTGSCWTAPALSEYTLPGRGRKPGEVAAAGDGSVWFSDQADTSIGRLEPSGALTRYHLPAGRTPGSLAVAADGSVWFTTTGPTIAHLTASGRVVGYAMPPSAPMRWGTAGAPGALAAGPDHAIWFVNSEADKVGRITDDRTVSEDPLPSGGRMHVHPDGIVAGPDGAMWFTETLAGRMGRIDPRTFAVSEFPIPSDHAGVPPGSMTAGPDRALWFDGGSGLGRMTTRGDARWFPLPGQGQYAPTSVVAGPDGRIWTIDSRNGKVLRMTLQGQASELPPVADPTGLSFAGLRQLTAGPDAVWFAEPSLNRIGR